ncbi:MAG: hypothetical protein AB8B74_15095 [Crocinitomicaceae bacterium]
MKKSILVFIGVVVVLLCFFYFYKVELFQAEITSGGSNFIKEVSFSAFFEIRTLPDDYAIKPTMQGWLLLAAIFLGLPTMIAHRVTLKRYPRRAAEKEN